ncbi:MAG: hypothetical protein JSW71_04635 [Gemmatimonadota bacterium]|nr:MAG: hypothetical protein JSW71_04635 [Gemmatimonadota bacterium]
MREEDDAFKLVLYDNPYQRYRALVGFAGFAGLTTAKRRFSTIDWLMATLPEAMGPPLGLGDAIGALERACTDRFSRLGLPVAERPLIVILAGFYLHPTMRNYPFLAIVTNCHADDASQSDTVSPTFRSFSTVSQPQRRRSRYKITVCRGNLAAVYSRHSSWLHLRRVFRKRNLRRQAKIALAVRFIREVAADPVGTGVIGTNCLSGALTEGGNAYGDAWYVDDRATRTVMPHFVNADGAVMANLTVVRRRQ